MGKKWIIGIIGFGFFIGLLLYLIMLAELVFPAHTDRMNERKCRYVGSTINGVVGRNWNVREIQKIDNSKEAAEVIAATAKGFTNVRTIEANNNEIIINNDLHIIVNHHGICREQNCTYELKLNTPGTSCVYYLDDIGMISPSAATRLLLKNDFIH